MSTVAPSPPAPPEPQEDRPHGLIVVGYVTAVVLPIVGFILGIVAVTRPNKWASKHGVWIIVVSIVATVLWVAAIAAGVNSSVKKAEHEINHELSKATEALKQEQRAGVDASAKELARTAQTTAETIAVDNNGSYESVTPTELSTVEPSIRLAAGEGEPYLSAASGTGTGYEVTATAAEGDAFTISSSEGSITRTCTPRGTGGCPAGGRW